MHSHDHDCDCRRCVMDREFYSEMANPANHAFDVDDLDDADPEPVTITTTAATAQPGTLTLLVGDRMITTPVLAGSSVADVTRDVARAVNAPNPKPRSRAKRRR